MALKQISLVLPTIGMKVKLRMIDSDYLCDTNKLNLFQLEDLGLKFINSEGCYDWFDYNSSEESLFLLSLKYGIQFILNKTDANDASSS